MAEQVVATEDYCRKIYTGEYPGLFRLNYKGAYGDYVKYEIIYADLGHLFSFEMFQNPDIQNDYKFEKHGDGVAVYPCEIVVDSSISIRKI